MKPGLAQPSFRPGGIRRRLLIWNLSLFGVVLAGVMLASYMYAVAQMKQRNAELQSAIASVTADRIASFVEHEMQRLADTAAAMSLYDMGAKEQQFLAALVVKNDPTFTDATVLSDTGLELVKLSDRRIYLPSEIPYQSKSAKFRSVIKGNNYISPVYTSGNAQPYVTLAVPLKIHAGEVIGVLSVEANLHFLWQLIGDVQFGAAGYAYLVDGQGNLIAHQNPSLVLKKMDLSQTPTVEEFLRTPKLKDPTPAYEHRGIIGLPG